MPETRRNTTYSFRSRVYFLSRTLLLDWIISPMYTKFSYEQNNVLDCQGNCSFAKVDVGMSDQLERSSAVFQVIGFQAHVLNGRHSHCRPHWHDLSKLNTMCDPLNFIQWEMRSPNLFWPATGLRRYRWGRGGLKACPSIDNWRETGRLGTESNLHPCSSHRLKGRRDESFLY